jgi:hypothetical protein
MRYLNYYRLLTLKQPNRMGFGYAMLFIIVYLVQWNLLFSEPGVTSIGLGFLFLFSIFTISVYAIQTRFDPTNPLYQYPLVAKERVKYEYISVVFVFLATVLLLVLFMYLIIGLVALFGSIDMTDGNVVPANAMGDLYVVVHYLFLFAFVMPLSYLESVRKRFVFGFVVFVLSSLMHIIVLLSLTGSVQRGDMRQAFLGASEATILVPVLLSLALTSLYASYRLSVKMNAYR